MEAIVVYGTNRCADCHTAKAILDAYHVSYKFVNIDGDEAAASMVMEINGGRRVVPTMVIDGTAYTNPTQLELRTLIEPYAKKQAS